MKTNRGKPENFLYVIIALCAVSLVMVNFVFKDYLTADTVSANENNQVLLKNSTLYRTQYFIKLAVSNQKAVILLNGELPENEIDESGYITLGVYTGDVLHIDLTAVPEETVTVFVEEISGAVSSPMQGTKLLLKGGITKIFTIECAKD